MAGRGTEHDFPLEGMELDSRAGGSWFQNMQYRRGAWEVRPGLGQVAQFDTLLGLQSADHTSQFGYSRILGAHVMLSNQGHLQVLVLCELLAFTGQVEDDSGGMWQKLLSLSIYDVTTGARWEEILHRSTASLDLTSVPMPRWYAQLQTCRVADFSDVVWGGTVEPVYFHEYADSLFFGSKDIGMFVYRPGDFMRTRRMQLETAFINACIKGLGESSVVFTIAPVAGDFSDAVAYLDSGSFPWPVDVCSLGDRLVLAKGREVYVTDAGRPGSIMGLNVFPVPADDVLVSVGSVGDVVYACTRTSTWMLQFSGGVNLTARVSCLSTAIGCLSPAAMVVGDRHLYWVDAKGMHAANGTQAIETVSGPIEPFFNDTITNPLTSYWVDAGFSDLSQDQPRTVLDFNDPEGVSLAFDPVASQVLLSVPSQGIVWVWLKGVWSLWCLESVADGGEVASQRNIAGARVLAGGGEVFVVAGPDVFTPIDRVVLGGVELPENHNAKMGSWFLLQLGRGGGLDRSVEAAEDNRVLSGYYRYTPGTTWGTTNGELYLGEPVRLEDGYRFPVRGAMSNCWLVPVFARFGQIALVDQVRIAFRFDNARWRPVTRVAGDPRIDLVMPPERVFSQGGWGLIVPVAAVSEAQVRNAAGVADATGNVVRCYFDGTAAGVPAASDSLPYLNIVRDGLTPLFYIGFQLIDATPNVMSMGIEWTSVGTAWYRYDIGAGIVSRFMNAWHWMGAVPGGLHGADDVAQPVDWVVQPGQFLRKDGVQMLFRALYMRLTSEGGADEEIYSASTFGLFNVVVGSDARTWAAQILDFAGSGIQRVVDKSTIRTRLLDPVLGWRKVVFGNTVTWGAVGDSTKGNVLLGDTPEETMAVSDAVRGESLAVMMFGHIRNRAERVSLSGARMLYRLRGGRRMEGR